MPSLPEHERHVSRLYRQTLKLVFDWSWEHDRYRSMCMAVRKHFDEHLNGQRRRVDDVEQSKFALVVHHLLWKYKHPEPYQYPASPRGVAWEREERLPQHIIEHGWGKGQLRTLCGMWDYMIDEKVGGEGKAGDGKKDHAGGSESKTP